MCEDRLNALTLLHVHPKRKVDPGEITDIYINSGNRRVGK
jgi:hypothetical protein